jgi:hypothetical protein
VRCAQNELVGPLVVEVDEARVGFERLSDFAGNEPEDFLEIERRIDGRDRLGQELQVSSRRVDLSIVGRSPRRRWRAAEKSHVIMLNKTLTPSPVFRHRPWIGCDS